MGETRLSGLLSELEKSENYVKTRVVIANQYLEEIKTRMPHGYARIKEKEEHYQFLIRSLESLKTI